MDYSNFKNPIGLLKRMLLSGNRVAYFVLFREFLVKLMLPMDYLLSFVEKKRLRKTRPASEKPLILILGGSRSGTTLLYQVFVRYLPVGYISNFIALFPRSPISAYALFRRMLPKADADFKNYFGSAAGLSGPNDAFGIWNRWFGEDRNRVPDTIPDASKRDVKRFFDTWFAVTEKPFVNKNNRNSLHASLFDKLFENSFFVEIHRNPIYVVQSLILSRRTVQGSDKIGWGLLADDSKQAADPLGYIDGICEQVYRVDQVIARERAKIDPEKYIRIAYKEFCRNPAGLVIEVARRTHQEVRDLDALSALTFSTASNGKRLGDDEFERICQCVERLYGNQRYPINAH